jgi:hypothetical protein
MTRAPGPALAQSLYPVQRDERFGGELLEGARNLRNARGQEVCRNVYYHELVKALNGFGYRVQNKARGDFEIEGVSGN